MSATPSLICNDNENKIARQENWLFLKQWLRYPTQLGTFAPISKTLAHQAASLVANTLPRHGHIIELGAGTGRLTRALLHQGIAPQQLATIELDEKMHSFLKATLPAVHSICGDAANLQSLLPEEFLTRVSSVVSVIPFMYFPLELRKKIVDAVWKVLPPDGVFFHVTYSPTSPLQAIYPHIQAKRVLSKWRNVPPGFVWKYHQ